MTEEKKQTETEKSKLEELDEVQSIFRRFPILDKDGREVGAFQLSFEVWTDEEVMLRLDEPIEKMHDHLGALQEALAEAAKALEEEDEENPTEPPTPA